MSSGDRMRAIDRNAASLGIPQRVLMESSGNAIARRVRERCDPGASVTILAGRGNNGGDGFVAARFLSEYDVHVRLLGHPETIATEIARRNWDALAATDHDVAAFRDATEVDIPPAELVVDAMLGTGIAGALREPVATAVEHVNAGNTPVLAVDVPTGMDPSAPTRATPVVGADSVVTFHAKKPGLDGLDVPVTVADIGIPRGAERQIGPGDLSVLEREATSHKGDAGRVLVIGGGPYAGAPALSGLGALRAGADLAVVATPANVASSVAGFGPDLIVRPLAGESLRSDHVADLNDLGADADCVVLGPGLGDAPESIRAVESFLTAYDGRCIVDADALQVIPDIESAASLICTPHQGEFADMGGTGASDPRTRERHVTTFADDLGYTILLKGHVDIISDGDRTRSATTGNPGMTVGGTGDVLAGVVGGLYARLEDPVLAAGIGAYVTGRAGDLAAARVGDGLIASDLLEHVPVAIEEAAT